MAVMERKAQIKSWLFDVALPLWSTTGIDKNNKFIEVMDFDATPDLTRPRRMRVQARQLYCLADAKLMGWAGHDEARLGRGFAALKACWATDGAPGFVHIVSQDGAVVDARRDAYDHAFGLFAAAYYSKATSDPEARALAHQILAFIDDQMTDPVDGSLFEQAGEAGRAILPRRQNPHMHYLEALLAWYDLTGEVGFKVRIDAILDLFLRAFYDPSTASLGEYFTRTWAVLDTEAGQITEPGHHFEWVWLLNWAHKLGIRDLRSEARALFEKAYRFGRNKEGYALDEMDRQGVILKASRRTWPQNEALKAYLAMAEMVPQKADDYRQLADDMVNLTFKSYLSTEVPGLWYDQFDKMDQNIAKDVPASTLYHIQVAFQEYLMV